MNTVFRFLAPFRAFTRRVGAGPSRYSSIWSPTTSSSSSWAIRSTPSAERAAPPPAPRAPLTPLATPQVVVAVRGGGERKGLRVRGTTTTRPIEVHRNGPSSPWRALQLQRGGHSCRLSSSRVAKALEQRYPFTRDWMMLKHQQETWTWHGKGRELEKRRSCTTYNHEGVCTICRTTTTRLTLPLTFSPSPQEQRPSNPRSLLPCASYQRAMSP